ncbi:hypothetical protein IFR05_006396 [Cadophora sp. M221]|nr:hypothetical protein IFR05_006396 [Cadophora sp. M221]
MAMDGTPHQGNRNLPSRQRHPALLSAADFEMRTREAPDAPWPRYRLLELGCDLEALASSIQGIRDIFSELSHVESLSVFSQRCPFLESDKVLVRFCAAHICSEDPWFAIEPAFGHKFQDYDVAIIYHRAILSSLYLFNKPIKRLFMDSVPVMIFPDIVFATKRTIFDIIDVEDPDDEIIIGTNKGSMSARLKGALSRVQDLHMNIVMDTFSAGRTAILGATVLGHFLGNMPELKALTLICSDVKKPAFASAEYLDVWHDWHTALFGNRWESLETLRLQDFRTPDRFLLRFLTDHASSIRRLSLTGCFLGHSDQDWKPTEAAWEPHCERDNFRRMMEDIRDHTTLDEIKIKFSNSEGRFFNNMWKQCEICDSGIWELADTDWKSVSMDAETIKQLPSPDHFLLNCFIHGLCSWPMAFDGPDLANSVLLGPRIRSGLNWLLRVQRWTSWSGCDHRKDDELAIIQISP